MKTPKDSNINNATGVGVGFGKASLCALIFEMGVWAVGLSFSSSIFGPIRDNKVLNLDPLIYWANSSKSPHKEDKVGPIAYQIIYLA